MAQCNAHLPLLTDNKLCATLAALAHEAHDLQRDRDRTDETVHAFCLPGLAAHREAVTLREARRRAQRPGRGWQSRLAAIQARIDDIVFDLYGLSEADRALLRRETGTPRLGCGISLLRGAQSARIPARAVPSAIATGTSTGLRAVPPCRIRILPPAPEGGNYGIPLSGRLADALAHARCPRGHLDLHDAHLAVGPQQHFIGSVRECRMGAS